MSESFGIRSYIPNPELEDFRKNQLNQESTIYQNECKELEVLLEEIPISARIKDLWHVDAGINLRKNLVQCIHSGAFWKDLGAKLLIEKMQLEEIDGLGHHEPNPGERMLKILDSEGVLLKELFTAIWEEQRLDIFEYLKPYLKDYLTCKSQKSMPPEERFDSGFSSLNVDSTNISAHTKIKDLVVPQDIVVCRYTESFQSPHRFLPPKLNLTKKVTPKEGADYYILLTYSGSPRCKDQVIAVLKKKMPGMPVPGVVDLPAKRYYLEDNPNDNINKIFHTVRFVVPIITEEYLQDIAFDQNSTAYNAFHPRFLYNLMTTEYTSTLINRRVRPLIDDAIRSWIPEHGMLQQPFFQSYRFVSQVEEMAQGFRLKVQKENTVRN